MTVNIKGIFRNKDDEESIDFESIFKHLISQKKISIFIFLISFFTIFIPLALKKNKDLLFQGEFELLIQDPIALQSPTSKFSSNISLAGLSSSLSPSEGNLNTLKTYLKSNEVLGELASKFGYKTKELASFIEITLGGENKQAEGILNVYLEIDNALKGEVILNGLSKTFISASTKYNLEKLKDGLKFINSEKPNFERKVELLQKEFYKFEEKYKIIRGGKDNTIINIIKKDNSLKDKIKDLEDNGNALNLQKAGILKKRLLEIEGEFKKPTEILNRLNSIEKEIVQYSIAIKRFISLSETYRLEIAQNTIPWRIISPPLMNKSPKKVEYLKLFTLSSFASGFVTLSILFSYIKLKNRFRDEADIKNFINIPCLGSLPILSKNEISEIKNIKDLNNSLEDKKSNFVVFQKSIEEYCIGIKNLNESKNFKTFFLASPFSQEVKTLVNVLSSKILSSTNERVILIDTNFGSPILDKFFNLNSSIGVLDYLANEKIQISQIINKSNINNYLDIISSGQDLSNKMLLGSLRMKELIENLKNNYQYIFINGSSINNSPQSVINGNLSDLTTILISTNNLKKSDLVKSVDKLSKAGSNIDAYLIINQDLK
ncbi:conserved hypothetical protein [Prochlorococcus marinus subsp. pastoris str. CCMP1986]|uniref:Polysaccharide chain length determinant N-terminal domain-containing protein n=1 Tax=Prochlorococcus marinus subsp. pastoris (strain CCMP1986 / NIES-2087 / MED4) TaxID=59919 RepID=Q7V0N1_PROMP|nr:hypothetical protein [Prochlorococcus marinus]KGF87212.1 putative tyrosine-protein kinase ptk [Prochlorococcus marinus str. EQPAC1]CAE19684.1 conserved hypothetical protein [Prochlorococcus marinus subsp. pastoris str. CCMP1986]